MNRRLTGAAVALAALVGSMLVTTQPGYAVDAAPGFHVTDGRLQDANNQDVVLRGINHAHTWYPTRTTKALQDIKATGANSVRVVLSTGDQWTRTTAAEVADLIAQCRANRLLCVLEAHDTTGYGEQSAAVSLSRAVDYWIAVQDALKGQEKYVILNIGNEPFGNTGYSAWTADTKAAVQRLRTAGFTHTLMVDAPNWGQDWSFTMRDNAAGVFAADPQHNTVFSIHMYGVFDTAAEVDDYLNRFVTAKLPIVVGEFGSNHSDGNPDEDAIMATTQRLGLGYLGWSWSGNSGGVEYLDMATGFDATRLTPWGQRLIDGANGIRATAKESGVFGGGGGDTQAPTAPGTPTAGSVTSGGARLTWTAATDNTAVTAYDVVRVTTAGESAVTTVTGTGADLTGLTASTRYDFAVYARDAAGNRSPRSGIVTVTTGSGGTTPAGACSVSYRLSDWGSSFNGDVTIRNLATTAVNGWALDFAFPGPQRLTSVWNAKGTQSGADVHATNESWNQGIPAGGSVNFGFSASSVAGTNGIPATFVLNGATCSIG
ncbi:cellulase family glycosylhydrolase [Kitasatospora sp. NPDC057223]|uniref:cellulase family glycosylhydrolase n=1 Tax=Kitasatospora sp. NPDC057223 TaxID=3346055 RepID=UPI003629745B